jgi:hypothetical protein
MVGYFFGNSNDDDVKVDGIKSPVSAWSRSCRHQNVRMMISDQVYVDRFGPLPIHPKCEALWILGNLRHRSMRGRVESIGAVLPN